MSRGRGRRGGHEEEHENHERWLVTYADMVTLLMVLFIVMFAMSQVDEKKFNALREGLAAGFGQSTSLLDGSSRLLEQPGTAIAAPIAPVEVAADLPPKQRAEVLKAVEKYDRLRQQRKYVSAQAEVQRLDSIRKRLHAALAARGLEKDVQMAIDERGLVVSLVSRHVVFEANIAELSPRGRQVVDALAPVLRDLTEDLDIDGHTNQVKVKPKYFPTDWELSAARAVRVLRHLNEAGGVPNSRMTASAYGHGRPIMDPRRPGSQRINKRVDIVVRSALPADTRELMKQVLSTRKALTKQAPGGGDAS
jgi:chemotaxis protein MotB